MFAENQVENPRITFRKPEYTVGDRLVVNCTAAVARPMPDVTWLLNGKKVTMETLLSVASYTINR